MPRASSRSSSSDCGELAARRRDELLRRRRVAADVGLDQPQLQRERDEPLLRAVVQVALEPPALGVAGRDDALARGLQLGEPRLATPRCEVLVLERDRGRGADRLEQLRVVVERRVVDERRDLAPVALDRRDRPLAGRRARATGAPSASA